VLASIQQQSAQEFQPHVHRAQHHHIRHLQEQIRLTYAELAQEEHIPRSLVQHQIALAFLVLLALTQQGGQRFVPDALQVPFPQFWKLQTAVSVNFVLREHIHHLRELQCAKSV